MAGFEPQISLMLKATALPAEASKSTFLIFCLLKIGQTRLFLFNFVPFT